MDQLELYAAAECRALDRYWIEQRGIPGYALMGRAAQASFTLLQERWPEAHALLVLCGAGNNAGDGWIVARLARAAGWSVRVVCVREPDRLNGDAARAAQDYMAAGGQWQAWSRAHEGPLPEAGVIVDALLGTGLSGPPQGDFAAAIEWANSSELPVLSLDLPSGLNADTGEAYAPCIRAQATVSFIAHKPGLYTGDAFDHTGQVHFAALLNASEQREAAAHRSAFPAPQGRLLAEAEVLAHIPRRSATTHKGQAGQVYLLAGGEGMPGAALLAGSAALRAGAGLVSLLTHPQHAHQLAVYQPELMSRAWPAEAEHAAALHQQLARAQALVLGPGLGQGAWAQGLFQFVFSQLYVPVTDGAVADSIARPALVLDADGLNLLATAYAAGQAPQLPAACIMTPHPGEAARLLGTTSAQVQSDRVTAAQQLAERYQAVVVLKGAGSVIARPSSSPGAPSYALCPLALGAMASAGMGDVLAGLLAALLGQGMTPWAAAQAGVWLHMQAAQRAAGQRSRGVLASDLVQCLPDVLP